MEKEGKEALHLISIKPLRGWIALNLGELWANREILYFLVWRGIRVRYSQTILGIAWAIIQPFFMMVVFSLFFGKFVKLSSENMPYPLFTYAGLLPWMLFTEGISRATNSLVQDANFVTKVYFPRLIMPISATISPLVDFMFAFLVFVGMMFYFGVTPSVNIFCLPVFLLLTVATSLAVGVWLSAINVQYRDVRYAVPYLIQFWFFASPIVYPAAALPASWQLMYNLNPMVGIIEGFRWSLLGGDPPRLTIFISFAIVILILISGIFYFRRMEKNFADVV